jgi:leucyl aminopeptidase (aminopeptidase T)
MPGITRQAFMRALPADYERLRDVGQALAQKLSEASNCRVTAPGGTEILLSLDGRTAICDDGNLQAPGAFGNLPAGEAYIAPCENKANGRIVFDGSLSEWGMLKRPLTVVLEEGRAINIEGGAAGRWLLETLDAGGPNGRVIAELGIGTNAGAVVSGLVLEDEKAAETLHFAFGGNTNIGGENRASVHLDAVVLKPRVELDGVVILDHGLPVA